MQAKLTASTLKTIQPAPKPFEVVDSELKGFLLRVQPSGRMTFYYSYRAPSGQRKRIKIGAYGAALTPAQARDAATKLAGNVVEGVDVQQQKAEARQRAAEAKQRTLGAFIEKHYQPWVLASRKSGQATLDRVASCFADWMNLSMTDITVRRVESWRTEQLKRGLKPSTINRTVISLRGIVSKAVEWGMLDQHPMGKLKPLAVDKAPKVRFLSEEEEARLLAALAARDEEIKEARERGNKHRAERGYPLLPSLKHRTYGDRLTPLVLLSLKTGLRRGEAFDLLWEDVNLKNKVITIRGDTAKSGHTRHIPLSPTAHAALSAWANQNEPLSGRVFPSNDGGRLDNVKKSWTALLEDAGIVAFRWHDMRHDFASKLIMKGVPLNTVRELCGHSDHNTTLRYAHLAPDHKADAVALIG